MNVGPFNETVMMDLAYDGTDWCVCKYLGNGKTTGELYRILEEGWIDWAEPPDTLVADSERGLIAEEFAFKLGKPRTVLTLPAGYAPWQKGKVARKIRTMCSIIKKTVLHLGLAPEEMKLAGIEAAAAMNQRPGVRTNSSICEGLVHKPFWRCFSQTPFEEESPSGVSPGMRLFGQRLEMYGELYVDGEPAYHHLDGNDPSTELGRRLQIKCPARQATEAHYAKEVVRKTVAARTRLVEKVDVGEQTFFYRCYPSSKAQKLQAQRGCHLGPGVVIGHQKGNAWVSYAGRCYLVAPAHIRSLAPDEACTTKPLIRQGLEELRKAYSRAAATLRVGGFYGTTSYTSFSRLLQWLSKACIDITRQEATTSELEQAADMPAGNDHLAPEAIEEVAIPPVSETAVAAQPIRTLEQPIDEVEMEVAGLQREVEQHLEEPGETTEQSAAASQPRPAPVPITWRHPGDPSNLEWKKQRVGDTFATAGKRIMAAKIKKKMLDKEIPYSQIPPKDRQLYHDAEAKEWADWLKNGSVKIKKGQEVKDVYKETDPARIINLRFVYRDTNASVRTPQVYLLVHAKARMRAQDFTEPLAEARLVKLDSPTVQQVGIMIFLQLVANFNWFKTWRKGDISSAFLQGTERDDSKGKLYLRPPRDRPLAGVDPGDLVEVLTSMHGLPDAPRAWFEEVTTFLGSLGFQHSRMDVAFMVIYHDDGSLGAMIVLHVDDIMVATDGSDYMEAQVEKFHAKYPFGEWEYVAKKGEIAYTGRQISLHGNEIHMGQADFVNGRMDNVPMKRKKNRSPESVCTPTEHAEDRSGVGNLHWATSQTRVDHAVDTSRLQKMQNAPTHQDYKDLAKVVKEVKDTADTVIKIRPVQNMVVAAFTDSSLYGSQGELIPDDDSLAGYDKHKLHSQGGSLLVIMDKEHLDDFGDVPFSFADWRTSASRRVLHSTFAAEAQAGVETFGLAKYYRAYLCDILFGFADWKSLDTYGESEIPIVLFTDCKSLHDNLKKEGSVPDDKWVAVPIASLRGAVSAGPGRDVRKAESRWVPSRWQLADCLTKKGLSAAFRERIASGTTKLHEMSLQSAKRNKAKGNAHWTWMCYLDTPEGCGSEPRSEVEETNALRAGSIQHVAEFSEPTSTCGVKPESADITTTPIGSMSCVNPLSGCTTFLPGTPLGKRSEEANALRAGPIQTALPAMAKQARRRKKEELKSETDSGTHTPVKEELHSPVEEDRSHLDGVDLDAPQPANLPRPGPVAPPTGEYVMPPYVQRLAEVLTLQGCRPINLEMEYRLENFNSLDFWGQAMIDFRDVTLRWLPEELELYVLRTDARLRLLYNEAYDEFAGNGLTPGLFRMSEETFRNQPKALVWVGLVFEHADVTANPAMQAENRVDFDIFHGTVLSRAHQLADNPHCTMTKGRRNKMHDHVKPHECYGGPWLTTLHYVELQMFGKANSESCNLGVITVLGLTAKSVRTSKGCNNRVQIADEAYPCVILIRPDDESVTLRRKDRYMSDYTHEVYTKRCQISSRTDEILRKTRAPWAGRCRKLPRRPDPEVEKNSRLMISVPDQEAFYTFDGRRPRNDKEEATEQLRIFNEEHKQDETDWPVGHRGSIGPTWSYKKWVESQWNTEGEVWEELSDVEDAMSVPFEEHEKHDFSKHLPSKQINPNLLQLLQRCRDPADNLNEHSHVWKEHNLHEIANALRFGSPALHTFLARTLHTNYGEEKRNPKRQVNIVGLSQEGIERRSDANARRKTRIAELNRSQQLCRDVMKDHNTFQPDQYRDPIWLGHLRNGWSQYEANCELRDRIKCALHNLTKQVPRGEALLNHRESEYATKANLADSGEEPEPIEWSDEDACSVVEDDVVQPAYSRPSQRWTDKHYTMEQADNEWNREIKQAAASRKKAKLCQGRYNEMDGRYHPDQVDGELTRQHFVKTIGRRTCQYFLKGNWCKFGYDYTFTHSVYVRDEVTGQRKYFNCAVDTPGSSTDTPAQIRARTPSQMNYMTKFAGKKRRQGRGG